MASKREITAEIAGAGPSAVRDASISVFYNIRLRGGGHRRILPDLRQRFLTHDITAARGGIASHPARGVDGALWQAFEGSTPDGKQHEKGRAGRLVADDLHPAVLAALGGDVDSGTARRLPVLTLTPRGVNLINGVYVKPPGHPESWTDDDKATYDAGAIGLRLNLSNSARARLGTTADAFHASISKATALFPSRIGLVIAEVKLHLPRGANLTTAWIEEALHIIAHRSRARGSAVAAMREDRPATIADLLAPVLPLEHCDLDPMNRLYTYTAAVVDGGPMDPSNVVTEAFRLSRHYTGDYSISPTATEASTYRPFSTVTHAFGLEGAASLVDGDDPFLGEQFLSRVEDLYLLLVALAYHEHIYLVDVVQKQLPRKADDRFDDRELSRFVRDYLDFRLRHQVSLVSNIELHNEVYAGLRKSLRVEPLSEKLSNHAAAAERVLNDQRRSRHSSSLRKSALADALPSSAIVFGLIFLAFAGLLDRIPQLLDLHWTEHTKNLVAFIGAATAGILAAVTQFRKLRREAGRHEDDGEEIEERRMEIAGEAAMEHGHELAKSAAAVAVH